jgi:hypothetical protein
MANPAGGDLRSRAARWLAGWDALGPHRTGTRGDEAGADWLAGEAAALGATVAFEEFRLDRLDPIRAFIEIDGERIEAIPVFDAPSTDAAGVSGRLGPVGGECDIAVAELSPQTVYDGEAEQQRRIEGHRGFVIVCAGKSPGPALLNSEAFSRPYGAPAIHVSSRQRELVLAAAERGAPARLVAESRRTPATARNVVVALGGAAAGGPPLVVMTPRSSWWQSTAERGGGIVCWLESLRALLAGPPARPVVFTANSGHELGHLGLDEFLARRPEYDRPASRGGATWVHYGANIGARAGPLSLMSADDDLRDLAAAELARVGEPFELTEKTELPNGETRDIHVGGGRYLTLVGENDLFHLPQDRWPDSVDLDAVTRIAAAAARVVRALRKAN